MLRNTQKYRGDGAGFGNPIGAGNAMIISDVFGPRTFSPHISTTGYDYDFHRGIDFSGSDVGDLMYAATNGFISRLYYQMFHWNQAIQSQEFEYTSGFSLTANEDTTATLSCPQTGSVSALTIDGWSKAIAKDRYISVFEDIITLEIDTLENRPTNGEFGIGIVSLDDTEWLAIGCSDTEVFWTANDSVEAAADRDTPTYRWLRLDYDGTDTWSIEGSADGDTFVQLWTWTCSFANRFFKPFIFYRSTATGSNETVTIGQVNFLDDSQTVGRFGNWVTICKGNADGKIVQIHMDHLLVSLGQQIQVGQPLGYIGRTGFNARSGRVNSIHIHLEYSDITESNYDQDEALNPLDADIVPRTDVSNNCSVVTTLISDTDFGDAANVRVAMARNDSDFDLNEVSYIGNLATRTVNFNTRAGLNADNDIPMQSGVKIVAEDFDEDSTHYYCNFIFDLDVVGNGIASILVKDTQGNTLYST